MKLPPFGKTAEILLQNGPIPNRDVLIVTGTNAWEFANVDQREPRLLLPDDKPEQYRWPVDRCECLVFQFGLIEDNTLLKLAKSLLLAGAVVVRILPENGRLAIFRKEL